MANPADHIRRVYSQYAQHLPSPEPFPKACKVHAPTLVRGLTNRILVYKGKFSPPHLGHLGMLRHAFNHSGRDLNLIAAIVQPMISGGRPVTSKASGKTVDFTQEERIALWNNDAAFPEWAWVQGHGDYALRILMYGLVETARKEGYVLEFSLLVGPDNAPWIDEPRLPYTSRSVAIAINGSMRDVNPEGFPITLICDAARKAWFDDGRMLRFEGCDDWRRLELETETLIREENAKAKGLIRLAMDLSSDHYRLIFRVSGR